MGKIAKLGLSVFVGLDIFVFAYTGLAQIRFMLFGEGAIPGGGSALDMALFLIPLFAGYLAGDRLFHFLNYKNRTKKARLKTLTPAPSPTPKGVWDERAWEEPDPPTPVSMNLKTPSPAGKKTTGTKTQE